MHIINNIFGTDPLDNKVIKPKKWALPYITSDRGGCDWWCTVFSQAPEEKTIIVPGSHQPQPAKQTLYPLALWMQVTVIEAHGLPKCLNKVTFSSFHNHLKYSSTFFRCFKLNYHNGTIPDATEYAYIFAKVTKSIIVEFHMLQDRFNSWLKSYARLSLVTVILYNIRFEISFTHSHCNTTQLYHLTQTFWAGFFMSRVTNAFIYILKPLRSIVYTNYSSTL